MMQVIFEANRRKFDITIRPPHLPEQDKFLSKSGFEKDWLYDPRPRPEYIPTSNPSGLIFRWAHNYTVSK